MASRRTKLDVANLANPPKRNRNESPGQRYWPKDKATWPIVHWLLQHLWPSLEAFVNGPEPVSRKWAKQQKATRSDDISSVHVNLVPFVVYRKLPSRAQRADLNDAWLYCRQALDDLMHDRLSWTVNWAPLPLLLRAERERHVWALTEPPAVSNTKAVIQRFRLAVILAAHPMIRTRLRKCTHCERVFMRQRKRRTTSPTYCDELACQSAARAARSEPGANAAYMRDYRATKKRRELARQRNPRN